MLSLGVDALHPPWEVTKKWAQRERGSEKQQHHLTEPTTPNGPLLGGPLGENGVASTSLHHGPHSHSNRRILEPVTPTGPLKCVICLQEITVDLSLWNLS